jgi:hypothetical protein
MGLETAFLVKMATVASAVTGAVSLVQGVQNRNDANKNARRAEAEQQKARAETQAQQTQRAAEERRKQVREERVRRARIIAASGGTGAAGSSGEAGGIGVLGTNLASNIGSNLGRQQAGANISMFEQNAATFSGKANQNLADAQFSDQLFNLSSSIFDKSGGFGSLKSIFGTGANMPKTE